MKLTKALFVLALAAAVAAPAYAETQNVKVSGSIDAYWFYRHNYDLRDNNDSGATPAGTAVQAADHTGSAAHRSEGDDFARTNTQIEVAADLTDNVSTVINLVNMRDWNADAFDGGGAIATHEFDVTLDLAYVQMKEIFYSPLTLTIGRQDIWWGRGFIIGNNNAAWDAQAVTLADEYSVTTAFDAVRATLDFNPWTVDFFWSNINENSHDPEDDRQLYAANVNYKFAEYNAVAEVYTVNELDRAAIAGATGTGTNETYTIGGRVQFDPISQVTLGAELAYQFGDYVSSVAALTDRDRGAWGADIFGTYRFVDVNWKPEVTLEYVHFSGESDTGSSTAAYGAWNFLFRGKFWTAYSDFREVLYATSDGSDQSGAQNSQFVQLKGAIEPMEDLSLELAYTHLWNDEALAGRNDYIGDEVDLTATYDYTEDVSFGLLAGWFFPGDFYTSPDDATATDIVSSMKVTF